MTQGIQIAFVGAGGIARAHLQALLAVPEFNVTVTGFADPDMDRCEARVRELQQVQPEARPQCFADGVELLNAVPADAVFIVLPPFAHGPVEHACLEKNIPFFVEKPIGLDSGLVREIAAEVEARRLLTSVGYMNRYRKGVALARQTLAQDPAVLMHGGWVGASPARVPGSWWPQKHLSGGQLVEQTTHTFDLVRYLGGEVREVLAVGVTGFNKDIPNYTTEDASAVVMKLERGGVASVLSCCAANGGGGGVWLSVYASKKSFLFRGWEHHLTVHSSGEEPQEVPAEEDIFVIEDRAFLHALSTGDRSSILCDYLDAARTLELTLAADRAMTTGQSQELD